MQCESERDIHKTTKDQTFSVSKYFLKRHFTVRYEMLKSLPDKFPLDLQKVATAFISHSCLYFRVTDTPGLMVLSLLAHTVYMSMPNAPLEGVVNSGISTHMAVLVWTDGRLILLCRVSPAECTEIHHQN